MPVSTPPDQAVCLGLPPTSSRLEARHTGGGLSCGRRNILGVHLGDGPGIIVLNGREVERTIRVVPVSDLKLHPMKIFCRQSLRLQVGAGLDVAFLIDPVCIGNGVAHSKDGARLCPWSPCVSRHW